MAEGKIDCMDETVIEESLVVWDTVVEEGLVNLHLLRLKCLIVIAFSVIVSRDELNGLLLLELLEVGILGGLAVCGDKAGVPEILLRDVEPLPKVCVAIPKIAEKSDPIHI